jgi:hypothetical protein
MAPIQRITQQTLDIGTFLVNPNKKRINQQKKFDKIRKDRRVHKIRKKSAWLLVSERTKEVRSVKVKEWVKWLEAKGHVDLDPERTERLLDVCGNAPPMASQSDMDGNEEEDSDLG